jgi:NADPH:quinone reductase-like Zn-dependent oxidoreductase
LSLPFDIRASFNREPIMKAFIVDRYGKDSGRVGDVPEPELRDDDVLVQVHAAGVNPLDSKIRDGEFKLLLRYRLPLILGNEMAGVVLRVGSRVRQFKPGDEVYARPDKDRIGTFAELIAIDEADVANLQSTWARSSLRPRARRTLPW